MQTAEDFVANGFETRSVAIDQRLHMVHRRQDDRNQLFRGRNLALADPVERGFAMMGETGERIEAEHCARALERVQAAKHAVHQIAAGQVMREVEQRLFDVAKQLACLDAKGGDGILRAHRPSTFAAIRSS